MRRLTGLLLLSAVLPGCVWVSASDHAARLELLDVDGDGFLDAARGGDDCDDRNPDVNPGAPERCDIPGDDDCNGLADGEDPSAEGREALWVDGDRDGFGRSQAADGTFLEAQMVCPGAGFSAVPGDCDDEDGAINPDAAELCERPGDEDCDGLVDAADPDAEGRVQGFPDSDGDGYGAEGSSARWVCAMDGVAGIDGDCDDADGSVNPGVPEVCPGFGEDKDCSDEPRPCALSDESPEVVLTGERVGDQLVAGDGWFGATTADGVRVWSAPQTLPLAPVSLPGGYVVELDDAEPADMAIGAEGLLLGLPGRGSRGQVWHVVPRTGRLDVTTTGGTPPAGTFGEAVAWGCDPETEARFPGTVADKNGRLSLHVDPTSAGRFSSWSSLESTRFSVVCYGGRAWLAEGDPEAGTISYVVGVDEKKPSSATIGGEPGLGGAVLLVDLDQDGAAPDVVTVDATRVLGWKGPLSGLGDQTVFFEVPAVTSGAVIRSGDLNGDGNTDIVVGLPDEADGAGQLLIFASSTFQVAGFLGEARLTLSGSALGAHLGRSVAITDLNGDGYDDVIVGEPGSERALLVPGHPDW